MSRVDHVFPGVIVNYLTAGNKFEMHMKIKVEHIFLLAFAALLLGPAPCMAQVDEYQIKWIAQFPDKDSKKNQGLGDKISRVVFGKKPQAVVKPINVVAEDPDHFWILDQGAGNVFELEDGVGQPLKAMRKADKEFPSMVSMCEGPKGVLLFTDSRLNQVWKIDRGELSVFADSVKLNQPTGIAYNKNRDEIWVVETGAHRVSLFNSEGEWIRSIGKRGAGPGSFNFPTFIWIDAAGRIYVVDSMNFRVQIFDNNGQFISTFGESGDATGDMARPKGVAVDSRGHIYVADALFHVVQIFDREGRYLFSFGGQGHDEGEFWMPLGIYIDGKDFIYVADSYNARVQVFQVRGK